MADYKEEAWDEYFDNLPEEEYIRIAIESFPDFFDFDLDDEPKPKKPRIKLPKINFWETNWGLMILDPEIRNPTSEYVTL